MKIALIEYGLGNLFSVERALRAVKVDYKLTNKTKDLRKADKLVLPGVGAFGDGMKGLAKRGLIKIIREETNKGKPILGICLGMQLMMEVGLEFGKHEGLGLIPGKVEKMNTQGKLPQIGWNQIKKQKNSKLLRNIADREFFYFVHSFVAKPTNSEAIAATTNYGGDNFCSVIEYKNIYGTQFHPEKSSSEGIKIYKNFVKL